MNWLDRHPRELFKEATLGSVMKKLLDKIPAGKQLPEQDPSLVQLMLLIVGNTEKRAPKAITLGELSESLNRFEDNHVVAASLEIGFTNRWFDRMTEDIVIYDIPHKGWNSNKVSTYVRTYYDDWIVLSRAGETAFKDVKRLYPKY